MKNMNTSIASTPDEISTEGIILLTMEDNQNDKFKPGTDTTSIYYTAQLNLEFLDTIGTVNKYPNANEIFVIDFIK
jgi:ribonucleotide reductase alpha subunit